MLQEQNTWCSSRFPSRLPNFATHLRHADLNCKSLVHQPVSQTKMRLDLCVAGLAAIAPTVRGAQQWPLPGTPRSRVFGSNIH